MARIFTRNWFWLLMTTLVPVLWQVLTANPAEEAAQQAASAAQIKAALAVCQKMESGPCGHKSGR